MAIVCKRQLEIEAFRPRACFDLWADVAHAGETVRLPHRPKDEARIHDEAEAGRLVAPLVGWTEPIRVLTERKRQSPPRLPQLSALQAKAAPWLVGEEDPRHRPGALRDPQGHDLSPG